MCHTAAFMGRLPGVSWRRLQRVGVREAPRTGFDEVRLRALGAPEVALDQDPVAARDHCDRLLELFEHEPSECDPPIAPLAAILVRDEDKIPGQALSWRTVAEPSRLLVRTTGVHPLRHGVQVVTEKVAVTRASSLPRGKQGPARQAATMSPAEQCQAYLERVAADPAIPAMSVRWEQAYGSAALFTSIREVDAWPVLCLWPGFARPSERTAPDRWYASGVGQQLCRDHRTCRC